MDKQSTAGTGPGALPAWWVSSRVRKAEPCILGALALGAAVTGALAPGLPVAWLLAFVALAAAAWAWTEPASHPAPIALRGTLMACAALLLEFHDGAGAQPVLGVAAWWLAATAGAYACLLRLRWCGGIAMTALAVMVLLATLLGELPESPAAVLALMGTALLSGALAGARLRHADQRREGGHVDAATGLCSREGLLSRGQRLAERARRSTRPMTLALLDAGDLLEVRAIYGSAAARELAARLSSRLEALAGKRGIAARAGTTEFAVLLPGGREQALHGIEAMLGSPCRIEFDIAGEEIVLVPEIAAAELEHDDGDLAEQLAVLGRQLAASREQEARRRRYLRRERERHSRPMALRAPQLAPA